MNSKKNSTALIMLAVIVAFGLVMATAAVLPIIPQAHAISDKASCHNIYVPGVGGKAKGEAISGCASGR